MIKIETEIETNVHVWCSQCSAELEVVSHNVLSDGTNSIALGFCPCRNALEDKIDELEDINTKLKE